jgi:ribonucleoside-diphosphate reductase alpha chain
MLMTGEPGFSVDFDNPRESLRNACTEVVSEDDSDVCNLGSLNMGAFPVSEASLSEFKKAVWDATTFLLAGTLYSDVPYQKVADVRTSNRRLGLGLMGVHEWCLKRNLPYGPSHELTEWLHTYRKTSDEAADHVSRVLGVSRPKGVRAIAPTGTIGIVAETTTSMEPLFCVAYKRRYKVGDVTHTEYVVDPVTRRMAEQGINPDSIEDSYTLAQNPERRIAFQSYLQSFVDQAISSTLNLPAWGSAFNNESKVEDFKTMLFKYLPSLRGMTCYPDGSRGGQPLTRVSYQEAVAAGTEPFIEGIDICDITKGGSCGA